MVKNIVFLIIRYLTQRKLLILLCFDNEVYEVKNVGNRYKIKKAKRLQENCNKLYYYRAGSTLFSFFYKNKNYFHSQPVFPMNYTMNKTKTAYAKTINPNIRNEEIQKAFIWYYLKYRFNLSNIHTAAIMGNIEQESLYSPTNAQDSCGYTDENQNDIDYIPLYSENDGVGWGLCQ